MSSPYDSTYAPPAPTLALRLAASGDSPKTGPLTAIVDTGSDATLIPNQYLEQVEAVDSGDAVLRSALGETREVHLYEVDIHLDSRLVPGVIVVGDDYGAEIVLGRDVLNKLILLLDGPRNEIEVFDQHPRWH